MAAISLRALAPPVTERWQRKRRALVERVSARVFVLLAALPALLLLLMIVGLALRTRPIVAEIAPGALLAGRTWLPMQGQFGFLPFIAGTAWVTACAMAVAVPPSLLTAIYLVEYAGPGTRALMKPLLDVLAGIPSVVYGVWGVIVVVPFVQEVLRPLLAGRLGFLPLFRSENPTGYGVLAGGIVLAVMVAPFIIAITYEVLQAVPGGLREASLALGATRWQTAKHVILKRAAPGIIAAVVLGFSRAFGETMAVLMVVGNVPQMPRSLFDPAYPLTALIANNYGEMLSIPRYDAALMAAALILLVVVLAFNIISALILRRVKRSVAL